MKPKLSLVGAAARPNSWPWFYKGLKTNKIEYEILFLGPNKPDFDLPKNFHFIQTNVKPPQCLEAGVRLASSDIIALTGDDLEFIEDNPLDKLYDLYLHYGNDKTIISPRAMIDGVDGINGHHVFFPDGPATSKGGIMSKKYYMELGGLDKNFIAIMSNVDLDARVWIDGGKIIVSKIFINELTGLGSNLCSSWYGIDRTYLESLYNKDNYGNILGNRLKPVDSFVNGGLLISTQGNKGTWI